MVRAESVVAESDVAGSVGGAVVRAESVVAKSDVAGSIGEAVIGTGTVGAALGAGTVGTALGTGTVGAALGAGTVGAGTVGAALGAGTVGVALVVGAEIEAVVVKIFIAMRKNKVAKLQCKIEERNSGPGLYMYAPPSSGTLAEIELAQLCCSNFSGCGNRPH